MHFQRKKAKFSGLNFFQFQTDPPQEVVADTEVLHNVAELGALCRTGCNKFRICFTADGVEEEKNLFSSRDTRTPLTDVRSISMKHFVVLGGRGSLL